MTAIIEAAINTIKVKDRFRKDYGDIEGLAKSIETLGLLQPIGIDANYRLIFGERRLKALERLGRDKIPARVVHVPSLLQAEHAENELRKDFTPSERVAIGEAIEAELGNRQGQRTDIEPVQNFAQVEGKKTREVAAEAAGFGNAETYRQAKKVVSEGAEELVEAMDRGEIAVSTAARIVELPPEDQKEIVANIQTGTKASDAIHNHRAQGTGENEWYTPDQYLDAARMVLGGIDLDPASSEIANERVQAKQIFTLADDGLSKQWAGRVWMNPPYSQPHIRMFAEKLVEEYQSGRVYEAIALTHNYTDTAWFHAMAAACSAICFTRGRIGFLSPEGKKAAPTQGQAFFYFGNRTEAFSDAFAGIGFVAESLRAA